MSRLCPKHLRPIVTDADWERPRPWQVFINQAHRDSNAALIDPRPEPGFWPTLAAFIRRHPRTWRVFVTIAGIVVLALFGSMFQ